MIEKDNDKAKDEKLNPVRLEKNKSYAEIMKGIC